MLSIDSLILYRGSELPLATVHAAAREVFGGHLRPDASLVVHASAPVRVDRQARGNQDPLAGTLRVLQIAVPEDTDSVFTALSPLVLGPAHGFPEAVRAEALESFGALTLDPLARRLSEEGVRVAVLYLLESASPLGAYSIFSEGRRLWSAAYRPAHSYATWNGEQFERESMEAGDPSPPEGDHIDFPPHGMQLLFGKMLQLSHAERLALLPSLAKAARPPSPGARSMHLVENGRFLPVGTGAPEGTVYTRSLLA